MARIQDAPPPKRNKKKGYFKEGGDMKLRAVYLRRPRTQQKRVSAIAGAHLVTQVAGGFGWSLLCSVPSPRINKVQQDMCEYSCPASTLFAAKLTDLHYASFLFSGLHRLVFVIEAVGVVGVKPANNDLLGRPWLYWKIGNTFVWGDKLGGLSTSTPCRRS